MEKVNTKKIIDEYFETKPKETAYRTRSYIDRQEVYEFEEKLGKTIFHMNEDELFDMILSFGGNSARGTCFAPATLNSILTYFRGVFDFYAKRYEVVLNPFRYQKLSISNVSAATLENSKVITKEVIDEFILKMRQSEDEQMADYVECITLLAYCGFKAEEIVNLKEDVIDFKQRKVYLPEREILLTPRCLMLLREVHTFEYRTVEGNRRNYVASSYKNGYFKFFMNSEESGPTDTKYLSGKLSRYISKESRAALEFSITYRNVFMCGVYDRLCKKWGKEKANEMITSKGNGEYNAQLLAAAKELGLSDKNPTVTKRQLAYFVYG